MKNPFSTDAAIEDLVNAMLGPEASKRDRHIYRESLRNLVRLAKSENMRDLRTNVDKIVPVTLLNKVSIDV